MIAWIKEIKGICENLICLVVYREIYIYAVNWTFFNRTHTRRRIAGPAVLAITLASVVGGGYQFPRRCDPPILPTTIKRLLSSNVYGYSAVITCLPGLAARLSRMDTAKANFTPDVLFAHCALGPRRLLRQLLRAKTIYDYLCALVKLIFTQFTPNTMTDSLKRI